MGLRLWLGLKIGLGVREKDFEWNCVASPYKNIKTNVCVCVQVPSQYRPPGQAGWAKGGGGRGLEETREHQGMFHTFIRHPFQMKNY